MSALILKTKNRDFFTRINLLCCFLAVRQDLNSRLLDRETIKIMTYQYCEQDEYFGFILIFVGTNIQVKNEKKCC